MVAGVAVGCVSHAEQLLLLATLERIRVLRGSDDLTGAGWRRGCGHRYGVLLDADRDVHAGGRYSMTTLARCAIERNVVAALVMAQIIGLTKFDHGLAMDLAASWYAHGRRYSTDPDKFSEAETVLRAAILEPRRGGGDA
jgi:hypothetical protein